MVNSSYQHVEVCFGLSTWRFVVAIWNWFDVTSRELSLSCVANDERSERASRV